MKDPVESTPMLYSSELQDNSEMDLEVTKPGYAYSTFPWIVDQPE
ncbi:hypothetical protein [Mycobacterium attenuatum]|nr:hypothetical protein [Mycobacterium attenuatum]